MTLARVKTSFFKKNTLKTLIYSWNCLLYWDCWNKIFKLKMISSNFFIIQIIGFITKLCFTRTKSYASIDNGTLSPEYFYAILFIFSYKNVFARLIIHGFNNSQDPRLGVEFAGRYDQVFQFIFGFIIVPSTIFFNYCTLLFRLINFWLQGRF